MDIIEIIKNSIQVKENIISNLDLIKKIENVTEEIIKAYKNGNKVLICGNGGSAADAQHIAAELSGRFYYDRPPLPAEALHVNSSYLTAVANDYNYSEIFSRMVKAHGKKGDILIGISTSGNSINVIKAIEIANKLEIITVGMTGQSGGKIKDVVKYLINVPSEDTPRIQEAHILIGHIICEKVEKTLFPK